jgi:CheY-like chemotaxis protein
VSQATVARRNTVLVVDDDEATRLALQEVLGDADYDVFVAGSGLEAMQLLRNQPVDAVIIDLMMPEMNGWDLASAIRSEPSLAATPMLVMTAYGAGVLATAPVASGYFSKPIALEPLLGVLRRTLTLRPPPPGSTQSPTFAVRDKYGNEKGRINRTSGTFNVDGGDGPRAKSGTRVIPGSEPASETDVRQRGTKRKP